MLLLDCKSGKGKRSGLQFHSGGAAKAAVTLYTNESSPTVLSSVWICNPHGLSLADLQSALCRK